MTKKLAKRIEYALRHAERARSFLDCDTVAVGRIGGPATTTLHYTRADGSTFYAINKDYGSDLTGLDNSIVELRSILAGAL